MYERFTDRARKAMQLAAKESMRFNHGYVGPEHILLGLVREGTGVAANVLKNLRISLRKIRREILEIAQSSPDFVTGELSHTPQAKKVFDYAMDESRNLYHNYVGTEHILLGFLREQEGGAANLLERLGLEPELVREAVLSALKYGKPQLRVAAQPAGVHSQMGNECRACCIVGVRPDSSREVVIAGVPLQRATEIGRELIDVGKFVKVLIYPGDKDGDPEPIEFG